ncbi:hypothetical protein [uncultured Actinomyces sp.]|uniref:hypothetical protein n=1 Tax=uncultured Actinomyces sp. TaxID=249061 RepID=UPI00260AFC3E|nr:hypothetical protein [uncultured Actinomyces sp.]
MKRRAALVLLACSVMILGACSSNDVLPGPPPTPIPLTAPSETSVETPTSSEDASTQVDSSAYELGANTELAQAGNAGYWFANSDHSVLCTIIVEGAASAPYVRCEVFPPFPVEDAPCDQGSFSGTVATLSADGAEYGRCQSDVPLQQMCLTDPASLDDYSAEFCENNLLSAPVLNDGETISAGGFTCTIDEDVTTCTHEGGQTMSFKPGDALR